MNKRHWNTVVLDGTIADAQIYGMIDDSYALVLQGLPKANWPVPWGLDELFQLLLKHDDWKQVGVATLAKHLEFLSSFFDRHLLPFPGSCLLEQFVVHCGSFSVSPDMRAICLSAVKSSLERQVKLILQLGQSIVPPAFSSAML
jgi:hypothetical protein